MATWSFLVEAPNARLEGWGELERLSDAVESNPRVQGASVSGGDLVSIFLSIKARSLDQAKGIAEEAATAALKALGINSEPRVRLVFDAEGNAMEEGG